MRGRATGSGGRPCFVCQAEGGIRDYKVTGVQTCALPIWRSSKEFNSVPFGRLRQKYRVVTRGTLIQKRSLRWALVFLFWTLIGLSFASQLYLSNYKAGRSISWGQAVGWSLGDWYVWAVMSLPIVQLARRYRFDDARWGRNVAVHLACSAGCSGGYMALRAWGGQLQSLAVGRPGSFCETFKPLLV